MIELKLVANSQLVHFDASAVRMSALPVLSFSERKNLPEVRCVYFIKVGREVAYIGQTVNLRNRCFSHEIFARLGEPRKAKVMWLIPGIEFDLLEVEASLIRRFRPKFNQVHKVEAKRKRCARNMTRIHQLCIARGIHSSTSLKKALGLKSHSKAARLFNDDSESLELTMYHDLCKLLDCSVNELFEDDFFPGGVRPAPISYNEMMARMAARREERAQAARS